MMNRILFIGMLISLSLTGIAQQTKPTLSFDNEIHDFGNIAEEEGSVKYRFSFLNTGSQPLVITDVKSSCGCTSPSWTRQPVMPGTKGYVEAVFDPRNRPGPFNKSITVFSNGDPSPIVLRIKGEVAPREKTLDDKYPFKTGNIRLKTNQFGMARVYYDQVKKETFGVANASNQPVSISFKQVPRHIRIAVHPQTLSPGEEGIIEVMYDAGKKDDWDFVYDRVYIYQNGKATANNYINISARITENFGELSAEEKQNAPHISFEEKNYNFGTVQQGTKVSRDFTFTNTGKSDLIIRKIRATCGCTTVNPSREVIAPGESGSIKAIFNTGSYKGRQSKVVFVITNDPTSPRTLLSLKGEVEPGN